LPGRPGVAHVVLGEEEFCVVVHDIPKHIEGLVSLGGSTTRENWGTINDQMLLASARADSLNDGRQHWTMVSRGAAIVESIAAAVWSRFRDAHERIPRHVDPRSGQRPARRVATDPNGGLGWLDDSVSDLDPAGARG
jgi:hypothetical protein